MFLVDLEDIKNLAVEEVEDMSGIIVNEKKAYVTLEFFWAYKAKYKLISHIFLFFFWLRRRKVFFFFLGFSNRCVADLLFYSK